MMLGLPPRVRRPEIHAMWDLGDDAAIDRYIEARVAERAQREAARWRFRFVVIETAILALLVLAAGLALGQNPQMVLRSAAVVALGCFATGVLLCALSAVTARLLSRLGWWRRR